MTDSIPPPEWEGRRAAMKRMFPNAPAILTCRVCEHEYPNTLWTEGSIAGCSVCRERIMGPPKGKPSRAAPISIGPTIDDLDLDHEPLYLIDFKD